MPIRAIAIITAPASRALRSTAITVSTAIAGVARPITTASACCVVTTDRFRDPNCSARSHDASGRFALCHQPEPARADIKREHCGVGDGQALYLAGHFEPAHHAAAL